MHSTKFLESLKQKKLLLNIEPYKNSNYSTSTNDICLLSDLGRLVGGSFCNNNLENSNLRLLCAMNTTKFTVYQCTIRVTWKGSMLWKDAMSTCKKRLILTKVSNG